MGSERNRDKCLEEITNLWDQKDIEKPAKRQNRKKEKYGKQINMRSVAFAKEKRSVGRALLDLPLL